MNPLTIEDITKEWEHNHTISEKNLSVITLPVLQSILERLAPPGDGDKHSLEGTQKIMRHLGGTDYVATQDQFFTLMSVLLGDRRARLKVAFDFFDTNGNGQISSSELEVVMSRFGVTAQEMKDMMTEADVEGNDTINFDEFCKVVPYEGNPVARGSPLSLYSSPPTTSSSPTPTPASSVSPPTASPEPTPVPDPASAPKARKVGTSTYYLQVGLFRLLQGAAYRSFRENYSAHCHTHQRVRDLPYTFENFVTYVQALVDFYISLGIVEPACEPLLHAIVDSVQSEHARLKDRIANWSNTPKTAEIEEEEARIKSSRNKSATIRQKFSAAIEFAISMKQKNFGLSDVYDESRTLYEIHRLQQLEQNEPISTPTNSSTSPRDYLKKWNRVIVESFDEEIDGAMTPTVYWYEDFMPKLLAACNVRTAADIPKNTIPDEKELDAWYESTKLTGAFDKYGKSVKDFFPTCSPQEKLRIRQAWNLTHVYLNGVQKQRERAEFGRSDGSLSHYVAFIDVYLNESTVAKAEMRLSFPYFLGSAVWHFFHTSAEITCSKPEEVAKVKIIPAFKLFFPRFATMYACPYCRHHLNRYVILNKEIDMYPLEYILLGLDVTRPVSKHIFEVDIIEKLKTVVDGESLRFFLWKLHNTVSSSIERTEPWYHKELKPFYTTRYWPSFESQLLFMKLKGETVIKLEEVERMYQLLKVLSKLSDLRTDLVAATVEKWNEEGIKKVLLVSSFVISELEEVIRKGKFLEGTYGYEPDADDPSPGYNEADETFSRSGFYQETWW